MTNVTTDQVMAALSHVIEPELHKDIVSLNMVEKLKINGGAVEFTVVLTTPACPLKGQIEAETIAAVESIPGVTGVTSDRITRRAVSTGSDSGS